MAGQLHRESPQPRGPWTGAAHSYPMSRCGQMFRPGFDNYVHSGDHMRDHRRVAEQTTVK
eukprot:scaffold647887_cov42-Prasinocladus_malaysianus.AAC.1